MSNVRGIGLKELASILPSVASKVSSIDNMDRVRSHESACDTVLMHSSRIRLIL